MTKHILIHAGFHKTGTTSLQSYLKTHKNRLAPYFSLLGETDDTQSWAFARQYAQRPFPWRLWAFRKELQEVFNRCPDGDKFVLSREQLSGIMPGHRNWRGKRILSFTPTAIPLCQTVINVAQRRFGTDVQLDFLFSVRERASWSRSVYGHLIRTQPITDSYENWIAKTPSLADPMQQAEEMRVALAPHKVYVGMLEEYATHRCGTAGMVLDWAQVPKDEIDTLPPALRMNTRQSAELEAEFLTMNRASPKDIDLGRMKAQLRAQERQ